jgi:hypothetical protein
LPEPFVGSVPSRKPLTTAKTARRSLEERYPRVTKWQEDLKAADADYHEWVRMSPKRAPLRADMTPGQANAVLAKAKHEHLMAWDANGKPLLRITDMHPNHIPISGRTQKALAKEGVAIFTHSHPNTPTAAAAVMSGSDIVSAHKWGVSKYFDCISDRGGMRIKITNLKRWQSYPHARLKELLDAGMKAIDAEVRNEIFAIEQLSGTPYSGIEKSKEWVRRYEKRVWKALKEEGRAFGFEVEALPPPG